MPGEHERHDLVANLQVGERVAVFVVGVEEQREDVLAPLAAAAAGGDLRVDQPVERAGCLLQTRPGREGAAEHAQGVVGGVEGESLLEQAGGIDRARGGAIGVEPEERAHGDAEGKAAGPRVEVDLGAGGEPVERGGGLLDHHVDRGGDPLAVKAGEHDQARAAVEVAVDREQPVAHQADQVAEVRFAPGEVGGVGDGDVVVGGGPEHEDDVAVEEPQREDRPEALVGLEQHRQRLVREAPGAREREARLAGRKGNGGGALLAQVAEQRGERVAAKERRRSNERHGRRLEQSRSKLAGRPVSGEGGALAYLRGTRSPSGSSRANAGT